MRKLIQRQRFSSLRGQFPKTYKKLLNLGKEPEVMPFWKDINLQIENAFKPLPSYAFLENRALRDTMFVQGDEKWLDTQIKYLKKVLGPKYRKVVQEDKLGSPAMLSKPNHKTSHNTIHHLYHLYYFMEKTATSLDDIDSVVEWGGGYGNFAKLWWRLKKGKGTYTIIDTSLFCSIQWLYLSSLFGKQSVNLLKSKRDKIVTNKINIVPISLLKSISIEGDLFVSTWGLSESSIASQDYVVSENWFKANHLLIGFQDSTKELKFASRLGDLAKDEGAKIIDIRFIPNNHYALK